MSFEILKAVKISKLLLWVVVITVSNGYTDSFFRDPFTDRNAVDVFRTIVNGIQYTTDKKTLL